MTVVSQEQPGPHPQSKAAPTVHTSRPDIVATRSTPGSRASSRARVPKPRQDVSTTNVTSKPATLALIRRTLISEASQANEPSNTPRPVEDVLPPLTSSNDVDLQLYAVVAIIVKDFVHPWYSKITQDHTFVEEIVQIIAHCSRALEERIRHTDIAELVLDDLAALLENHVTSYRTATSSLARQRYNVAARTTYHSLNPHPALEPVPVAEDTTTNSRQAQNEAVYRHLLVTGALAILLPTEDVHNRPLRILVGDIIADLILGQAVAEKVCEGWFLHDAIIKAIAASKQRLEPKASGQELRYHTQTRLEQFGLLNPGHEMNAAHHKSQQSELAVWFWRIAQWIYLIITAVWFTMQGILRARHLPNRLRTPLSLSGSLKSSAKSSTDHEYDQSPQAVLSYRISNFFSTFVRLRDHMPWLGSTFRFWQHVLINGSGQFGATNSAFDRFLHDILTTYVLTPNLVVSVLVGLRMGVFPNNSLGPPAPPAPTPDEQLGLRREAARSILSLIPLLVAQKYYDTVDEEEIVQHIEEDILDVLGDKYMNKHLIYGILELVLVRLVPELSEAGPRQLLAERGVGSAEADEEADNITTIAESNEKSVAVSHLDHVG